jgi:hypothetical protein
LLGCAVAACTVRGGPLRARARRTALGALAAVTCVGVLLAVPMSAGAVPGLVVASQASVPTTDPSKEVTAECPGGLGDMVVVGGGARVFGDPGNLVKLTSLMPGRSRYIFEDRYWFSAAAEASNLSRNFPWSLRTYAICVPRVRLRGYEFKTAFIHNGASTPWDHVEAVCPDGTAAWGTGAEVWGVDGDGNAIATGRLGLQLNRTDGPLGIARATAREGWLGYDGPWRLKSVAICASRRYVHPNGLVYASEVHSVFTGYDGSGGTAHCGDGFRAHGIGGGAGTSDSGPVFLHSVYPIDDLHGVAVQMTSSGGLAALTCAR